MRGLFTWAEMFKIKGIIWFSDTAGGKRPVCLPFLFLNIVSYRAWAV